MSRSFVLVACLLAVVASCCCFASVSGLPRSGGGHLPRALVELTSEMCTARGGRCQDQATTCATKVITGYCLGATDRCCKKATTAGASTPAAPALPQTTPTPTADQCAAAGGDCLNTAQACAGGSFKTGLCPGAANVQCCVKKLAPAPATAAQCDAAGGECKLNTLSCAGGSFKVGLCPGAANIQCCVKSAAPATPAAPTAQSSCSAAGGECKLNTLSCSGGSFKAGLCAGAANIQCCLKDSAPAPAVTPSVPATPSAPATPAASAEKSPCEIQGGTCKSNKASCATGFRAGLCKGAADIQCCGARPQAGELTPPVPTPVTPTGGPLTFSKLRSCYPQGETDDVKARIGGAVDADWITNTCAIRMSHTLNCAGKRVPNMGAESIQGGAPNHWNYIFRVKQLSPQVKKIFGNGVTVKATGSGGRGVPVSALKGKKAIIYFDTTGAWQDASGHFDLWDSTSMVEASHDDPDTVKRYFSLAISVTYWQIE